MYTRSKRSGAARFLTLLAAAAVLAAGCEDKKGAPPAVGTKKPATPAGGGDSGAIVVGHYGSLTGSEATFGKSTDNGIKLAIADINAAGGINGRKVELITYDDKGVSSEAGNAVTRLITKDKVVALLGEVASSRSLAGGAVAEEKGVPMITPSSTNLQVTAGKSMVFRVCFTDDQQTYAQAKFARENLKLSKAAILYDQSQTYSVGLRDDFKKAFESMGGTIVADQPYSGGDTDYSAQLANIRTAAPEIIFVPGYYTEGGTIARQARKLGITAPLLGGDGWDSEQLAKIGGDAIEGSYYSNHTAPDQPDSNIGQFIEKYKKAYDGQVPDALGGLGYDAAMVLFEAMKRAPSLNGKDLAKAIGETKGYKGITGVITIDENHNAKKPIVMVVMKNGQPHWVANVEPK
jgi:branched-chain amino acid transport system substrate-binding protein